MALPAVLARRVALRGRPLSTCSGRGGEGDHCSAFGRLPKTPNERMDNQGRRLLLPSDVRALNLSGVGGGGVGSGGSPLLGKGASDRPHSRLMSRNLSTPPNRDGGSPGSIPKNLLTPTRSTDPKLTSDDLFGARSGVYDVLLKNRKVGLTLLLVALTFCLICGKK